jgi:hypothetical protein
LPHFFSTKIHFPKIFFEEGRIMTNDKLAILITASIYLLNGCGGGGGSPGPIASTYSFPFAQSFAAQAAAGRTSYFNATQIGISTCYGSGSVADAPATTSTTFYITPASAVSAVSAVETLSWSWMNCTPLTNTTTSTKYYTPGTFVPLGFDNPGVNYGAYLTPPTIPASVHVGDTGITGTENLYADSSELVSNGHIDGSYFVLADTETSAIIYLIGKQYDASNALNSTEQDLWRITAAGVLTPINTTIQYTNGQVTILRYY